MIIPVLHLPEADRLHDPAEPAAPPPSSHREDLPCREGEIVICRDDPASQDWYIAQISKVLDRHVQVNYLHTPTPPLEDYSNQGSANVKERLA